MKKLLALIFACGTLFSFAQPWNFIGSSSGIANATEVDMEISSSGVLYIAYIDGSNSNKISVRKWDAYTNSWQLVGSAGIGDANVFDLQLAILANGNPVVAAKTFYMTTYEFLEIYKFTGSAWQYQAIGPGGYNQTEHNYDYSLRTSGNDIYLAFDNVDGQSTGYNQLGIIAANITQQTVMSPSSADLEQTSFSGRLSLYAENNNAYVIHSEADMSDYIPLDVSTNGGTWNDYTLDNSNGAYKMKIEKGNGTTTYNSIWSVYSSPYQLYYRTFNGTSFGNAATISSGSAISDFDFDTYYSDSYVFYKNSSSTCYFKKITAGTTPTITTITSGTSLAPSNATSLCAEVYQSVPVIAYVSGGMCYVKEYNLAANIEDWDNFTMCEGTAFNNSASNSIYLLDPNFSQANISMTVTSQNVSIIPNSAVSVSGSGLGYSVFVTTTNDVTTPTIVDLEFTLLENGNVVQTQLMPITVNPKPVINFTNANSSICENANPVNLNTQVSPIGGTWSGVGVLNNVFYPDYPTTASVSLTYSKTNQYGCTASDVATVTILQSPDLTVNTTDSDCNQNTGTASVSVSNGQSPYSIYWSSGSTQSNVTNLAPGQYIVAVTDNNNCLSTHAVMIGSTGISQSASVTPNQCYGNNLGGINVTVSGGTAPITYSWSNGATTEDLNNVPSGPYEVTITDGQGCVSTGSYTVGGPAQIMLQSEIHTSPNCSTSNGSVTVTYSGGTSPYNYTWSDINGAPVGTNNATLSGVPAGSYTCVMTDNNGCTFQSVHALSNVNGPVVAIDTVINSSCANDGEIQTTVISGSPQNYQWSNGATTANLSGLPAGIYSCVITGQSGCISVIDGTVLSQIPQNIDVCLVTVDTNTNTNLVVWEKPITNGIDHFNIYRETSQAGLYQLVGTVGYTYESLYNDLVASPNIRSWRYKVSSVDACGNESEISLNHKTIHLVINQGLGTDINLSWDSYEGFAYSNFEIHRHTDVDGWTLVTTMPSNLFTYTDNPPSTDGLIYTVTVAAPGTCTTTKAAQDFNTTRSNRDNRFSTQNGTPNGLEELLNQAIDLYPNPASDQVIISNTSNYIIQGSLLDASGRIVENWFIQPGQQTIDLSRFASGMYQLSLTVDGIRTTKRFVISK